MQSPQYITTHPVQGAPETVQHFEYCIQGTDSKLQDLSFDDGPGLVDCIQGAPKCVQGPPEFKQVQGISAANNEKLKNGNQVYKLFNPETKSVHGPPKSFPEDMIQGGLSQ